jgi:hypothetical protein
MSDDPYLVLGIARTATLPEVTEAYRALVQIYHPDRYAEAPARVQAEANKRMQALNGAYAAVKRNAPAPPPRTAPPRTSRPEPPPAPQPPPRPAPQFVLYVDGAPGYHSADVAPLGFTKSGRELRRTADARQCRRLNDELLAWFELQRSNADLATSQLYATWDEDEQASYAAKLGCSRVAREKAASFGLPCSECSAPHTER